MWIVFSLQTGGIPVGQLGRFLEWQFCLPLGALVVLLTLGIWVISRVRNWQQKPKDEESSSRELLGDYRQMIEKGLLHPDELARIKTSMDQRAGNDMSHPGDESTHKPPTENPPRTE